MYLITVKKSERCVWNMKTTIFINPFSLLEVLDNRINVIMILIDQGLWNINNGTNSEECCNAWVDMNV